MACPLCEGDGGAGPVLWHDGFCRVVRASSDDYPAFLRVILQRHASEMTDLDEKERERVRLAVACNGGGSTSSRSPSTTIAPSGRTSRPGSGQQR